MGGTFISGSEDDESLIVCPSSGGGWCSDVIASEYVMRDNDAKFSAQFDEVLKSSGAIVKRNTPLSPNLRAHVERFIQTLKFECLNKFVIVAEKHLDYICRIWSRHDNEERPHFFAIICTEFHRSS